MHNIYNGIRIAHYGLIHNLPDAQPDTNDFTNAITNDITTDLVLT